MPVPTKGSRKSQNAANKSSPRRVAAAAGAGSGQKKLSSLSSFQPMLSFGLPKSTPAVIQVDPPLETASSSSNSRTTSNTGASSSSRHDTIIDTTLMPPPPVPTAPRLPRKLSHSAPAGRSTPVTRDNGKGKGKQVVMDVDDVVEIIDSDDDESPRKRRLPVATPNAMWTDIYGPTTEVELAPGKARISKVKDWIYEALHGVPEQGSSNGNFRPSQAVRDRIRKYKRILIVTGPAGIGKATTIRLLADEMGVDLVEWDEGVEERSLGSTLDYESSISKLSSFLSRNSYPLLNLSLSSSSPRSTEKTSAPSRPRPRILFMTSLPNITHIPTREAFHAALLAFCTGFNSTSCPLVIVHSDAGSGGRAEESWMDRERGGREGTIEVVGKDVKDGPWCTEIDFLPLAPTFVTKALNRVIGLAISDSAKRPSPGAIQLIAQSSNGDLRSAINSIQLLCAGATLKNRKKQKSSAAGAEEDGSGRSRASGRGSRGGRGAKIDVSDEIRAALDAVTRREQSLNLFHALGKVFYNKRLGDPSTDHDDIEDIEAVAKLPATDPLPTHLKEFERRRSMIQMESYMPTIPVDASTFALWIHQNIPSFCSEIDQVDAIMEDFCAADIMRTDDDIWQSSPQAIAYALNLTVRGSLMALPSPVPRRGQKVVKPQFFQSYRTEKDNDALVQTAAAYLGKKSVAASVALSAIAFDKYECGHLKVALWGGIVSKTVLATETVPMAVKIQSLSRRPLLPASVQPLSLPPYYSRNTISQSLSFGEDELSARDRPPGEEVSYDEAVAGVDRMGVVPDLHEWDVQGGVGDDESENEEGRVVGWLSEDEIEEWD